MLSVLTVATVDESKVMVTVEGLAKPEPDTETVEPTIPLVATCRFR